MTNDINDIGEPQNGEKKAFTAEVGKILNLMIHSLYTNKDIFIRELISNASDACDKLRYLSQSDNSLMSNDPELKIKISIEKDGRMLIIEDNGIGMNKRDLEENLGTIAKSGTQQFFTQLTGDNKHDSQLIGQFGVGFYSSYMAADTVTVISKKAGETQAYLWKSDGAGEYIVAPTEFDKPRGTRIILHIKEGDDVYLDHYRVKNIVKTYSDHISMPIYFTDDETGHDIQVNSGSALWIKQKSGITEEQYQEFYKNISFAADKPWITLHNKNEGVVEYTNLLFVPTNKTFDLFHPDRRRRVKLFIKRVFITDENVDLIPHYLRFLRGIIDSEDLPLNISRENLQYNSTIDKIKNSITKKVLSELHKKLQNVREEYESFWQNFGAALKEGLCEFNSDHEQLLNIAIFYSCKQSKMITLNEYIASLPEEHEKRIYYLSGESIDKLKASPQIEGFLSRDIDVLLFTDSVDDFWVNVVNEYQGYEIRSVTRASIDKNTKQDEAQKSNDAESQETNKELLHFIKEILSGFVKDVIVSSRLTTSPVCLAVEEGDMDIRMERFLIEQKQLKKASTRILEINTNHPIIQTVANNVAMNANVNETTDLIWLLFDQACIIEGEPVHDVNLFSKRLINLMESA